MRFLAKILLIVGVVVVLEACCIKCQAAWVSGGCLPVGQAQQLYRCDSGCDCGYGCQCGPIDPCNQDCGCGYWYFQSPAPYINFNVAPMGLRFGCYQQLLIRYPYRSYPGIWNHRRHR